MTRIFLSHSSADARAAVALKRWLAEQRPQLSNEIFLDIDPESGLQLGARASATSRSRGRLAGSYVDRQCRDDGY